jgi:signal peptidase I
MSSAKSIGAVGYRVWKDVAQFVTLCCTFIFVHDYVGEIAHTKGPSMYPTFEHEGDVVLVEHLSRQRRTLTPGDVVISVCPHEPRKMICKRLVATEGQTVDVSGVHQHQPGRRRGFAADGGSPSSPEFIKGKDLIRVPKGHVWIQGDNLQNSTDSRYYGPVPYSLLRGRVFYKIWPPSQFGPIRDAPPEAQQQQTTAAAADHEEEEW